MPTKYHGAACKTCRRRGRKCTRELPACQSCIDKGIECEGYPLKWAGLASRGFLAGHAGVGKLNFSNSSGPSRAVGSRVRRERNKDSSLQRPSPQPSMNETDILPAQEEPPLDLPSPGWTPADLQVAELLPEHDLPEDDPATDIICSLPAADNLVAPTDIYSVEDTLIFPPTALNLFHIPPELSFILEYHYHEAASKLCVDNNTAQNPYREYIFPLALQRPALLYACAALSSAHYSTRHQHEPFLVEALRFRGKALSRLHESMWCIDSFLDESNLATLLMLILCDMCMGGHSNFETYFTMAKTLVILRGETRTPGSFVEQYISWMDIMSCASTSRQPAFTLADVASLRQWQLDWSRDVVPCAADLFHIFLEIVSLYKRGGDAADVDAQLESLKNRVLTCPPRVERGMPWFHLTEAYRFGVLLYAALLFSKDQDKDEVAWLVCSIIQHTKSIPSRSGWSDQLLWPLFHAGLRISDPGQRDWLREKLSEMKSSGGFRNVANAQEVLERCWSGEFSGGYAELLVREGVGDLLII